MPGLRLDRLIALTGFILLLLSPRVALTGAVADANKLVPSAETVGAPTEADSQRATEKSVGSKAETTPIPSTMATPGANDTAGESTANDKPGESSNPAGTLRPAIMAAPLPTPNVDQPLTEPDAAAIVTPTPAPNSDQPNTEASPAVVAIPAPTPAPNSDQPNMQASPADVATPAPTLNPNLDQPITEPSAAVAGTPTPKANPDTLTTEVPAATGLRSDNPQPPAASDNHPGPTTTAAPPVAPSQPAATTDAGAALDPDAPITEQLHGLANGKFDRIIGSTKERAAIDAFYSGRNYTPLWITDAKANARARAAITYLGRVWVDGLEPADYPIPNFASLTDPVALAEAEIRLTTSVITYAHHALVGRVHWSRVSGDIFYDRSAPDPREVLTTLVEAKDVGEALDAYEPHSEAYLALKAKLAEFRVDHLDADKTRIAKPNGRQSDRRTDIIIANMERWRWMPHDLGKTYVIVNLPDFTLRVMRQGKQLWMTKIVVGKPATPTPIMSAQMKSITVNPTWNVPPSIAANEYLPLLQQDPTILQRMGLRLSYNPDGTIHLSQPPGEQNALGQLRFNFPNKFLVYQHELEPKISVR